VNQGVAARSAAVLGDGAIDVSGGSGAVTGGTSGYVDVVSRERIDVLAPITANGGNTSGANGAGGRALFGSFKAAGAFASSAPLGWRGGSSTGATSYGGRCTTLTVVAASVSATAPITCQGGDSSGVPGGSGGTISIAGTSAPASVASVSAAGGAGSPSGAPGKIFIDNVPK
jgi:hypothetical protein